MELKERLRANDIGLSGEGGTGTSKDNIREALDQLSDARAMLGLIEIATRADSTFCDRQDAMAISAACYTARDKMDAAETLLDLVTKGGDA